MTLQGMQQRRKIPRFFTCNILSPQPVLSRRLTHPLHPKLPKGESVGNRP